MALLLDRLEERHRDVIAMLTEALHAGKAVTGLDEVWQSGQQRRGRLVVVE